MNVKYIHLKLVLVLLLSVWSLTAYSEVVSKAPNGFYIKSSVLVPVTSEQAYLKFLAVDQWWMEDHTYFGSRDNLSIEPKAGGCFCEKEGGKEVMHMTVSYVNPGKVVRLLGGLGPMQGMGLSGALTFQFEPVDQETSMITQEYRVTGYSPDGLEALADIVDQVQTAQLKQLQNNLSDKN